MEYSTLRFGKTLETGKMAEQQRHELTSSHGETHQGNNYIYTANSENNLNTGRANLPQLVVGSHIKKGGRGGDAIWNQTQATNYNVGGTWQVRRSEGIRPSLQRALPAPGIHPNESP